MRNRVGLLFILSFAIILQLPHLDDDLWWDAAVYYGMGKYLYSSGEIGLWENSRPLVLPLMFGFLWKVGFPIVFLKIVSIVFSLAVIGLVYLISLELFKSNSKALLAAAATGFFPVFFSFTPRALSEIPSLFFLLLSVYLILKNKYPLSGLFLGVAFMTRFFQMFAVLGILFFVCFQSYEKKVKKSEMIYFLLLFSLPIVLFLVFNAIQYDDPFLPFNKQRYLTQYTGDRYSEPFSFYFIELLKNNPLLLFIIPGFFSLKRNEVLLLVVLLLSTVPYFLIDHKELRLLLPAIPLLAIYLVKGYFQLFRSNVWLSMLFISVVCINWYAHHETARYDDDLSYFKGYIEKNDVRNAWISSPQMIEANSVKAQELLYYPRYDSGKINELLVKLPTAKNILINTCDLLPCPKEDSQCLENHQEFMEKLKQAFSMDYKINGTCQHYIFTRR